MAEVRKPLRLLRFEDLNEIQVDDLLWAIQFGDPTIESLPGGRVFLSLEHPWDHNIKLRSLAHVLELPIMRRSLTRTKKLYKRLRRSNCIIRCYLKTAEAILQEIGGGCSAEHWVFYPFRYMDNFVLACLLWVENRVPVVAMPPEKAMETSRQYFNDALLRRGIDVQAIKEFTLDKTRDLIETLLRTLPSACIPEPFIVRQRQEVEPQNRQVAAAGAEDAEIVFHLVEADEQDNLAQEVVDVNAEASNVDVNTSVVENNINNALATEVAISNGSDQSTEIQGNALSQSLQAVQEVIETIH